MQAPTCLKKKKGIKNSLCSQDAQGGGVPAAFLTGGASRATGHPNGARAPGAPRSPLPQRNGAHGPAKPGPHRPRGPRHAAPRTAPAGPPGPGQGSAGPGPGPQHRPLSCAPDNLGPGGRPATCRATCDTGPASRTGRAGRRPCEGQPGAPHPDPASGTWIRTPDLDPHPAKTTRPRRENPAAGAAPTHRPARLRSPQPAAAAAPALPRGLPEGLRTPSAAPRRLQGARARAARGSLGDVVPRFCVASRPRVPAQLRVIPGPQSSVPGRPSMVPDQQLQRRLGTWWERKRSLPPKLRRVCCIENCILHALPVRLRFPQV